jgi:hypothetical protein
LPSVRAFWQSQGWFIYLPQVVEFTSRVNESQTSLCSFYFYLFQSCALSMKSPPREKRKETEKKKKYIKPQHRHTSLR